MKILIVITLFAGMLLGLTETPAYSDLPRPSQRNSVAATSSASDVGEAAATVLAVEKSRADEILGDLKREYRDLDGVTVRMGATPKDEQAVAYYTISEIVISPSHTATLKEILAHEVWHVIDYRDNGRLDWGENLPPADSAEYLSNPA